MVINAGMYSFCAVLTAVTNGWVRDGVTIVARYTSENDWSISTVLYGMQHTAFAKGGGIEVKLGDGGVGGFTNENDIGQWLAGERL